MNGGSDARIVSISANTNWCPAVEWVSPGSLRAGDTGTRQAPAVAKMMAHEVQGARRKASEASPWELIQAGSHGPFSPIDVG